MVIASGLTGCGDDAGIAPPGADACEDAFVWNLPPGFPVPRVPEDNPMTDAKVDLGRHLFYDTRLSGNQTQSCASCHLQSLGFAEDRATSIGSTGDAVPRNAPGLANAACDPRSRAPGYTRGMTATARVLVLAVWACSATACGPPVATPAARAAPAGSVAQAEARVEPEPEPGAIGGSEPSAAPSEVDATPEPFPAGWVGVWRGTVHGTTAKGEQRFAMELRIAPIAGSDRYTWVIVYELDSGTQTRAYELVPVDAARGHYRIDEKNGIVIDGFLVGDKLHTRFSLNKLILTIDYGRRGDAVEFDVVTSLLDPPIETGGTNGIPAVKVYPLVGVQRAVLHRIEPAGASANARDRTPR